MKIAHLHWGFPPVIGGVESHLAMLGPELVKKECRVSLLTGSVGERPAEERYEGMYVRRTPAMDLNSLTPERIEEQFGDISREMARFIDDTDPDIIHAHNMHYFSPLHTDILNKIKLERKIPLVLTAHNVWPDNDRTWKEMNQRADIWDAVVAVSHYIKGEMVRAGYRGERITAVHHGIDLAKFGPCTGEDRERIRFLYPEFEGRRVIFHPARMNLEKGSHISVRALDIIRREFPDVLLVMAGTEKAVDWGSQHRKHVATIMGMIEEFGLKENIFVKFFPWQEMPLVYKAAEFCLSPSCFEEPFGIVMLESMASGRPVIVSRAGGMPEVISDGENGFIVKMSDANALAEKCLFLLKNPGTCSRMGEKGIEMVRAYWTKEKMTAATLEVYRNVLERKYKVSI